jgi:hypothetical protein
VGGELLRTIRLTSPTRKDRVLIPVSHGDGSWVWGKFRVKVVSSGRPVIIDGAAFFNDERV